MATITGSLPVSSPQTALDQTANKGVYYGGEYQLLEFPGTGTTTVVSGSGDGELTPVFRGENPPGTFVYSEGSPPIGASNVIIIGYT